MAKTNTASSWVSFKSVRQGFRWVPPGTFMMGSPEEEPGRYEDETRHQVTLTQGFWLAETTCTQALWRAVTYANPSRFKNENRPVEKVSWHDVQEFIGRLNALHRALDLRLPSEAEWEYACRAGTTTAFHFGTSITTDQVNYNGFFPQNELSLGENRRRTLDVKALPPNKWGLFQMHGNVRELCADWYGDYADDPQVDPSGPGRGLRRVLRGGSWFDYGRVCRSAVREGLRPGDLDVDIGFRLARGP